MPKITKFGPQTGACDMNKLANSSGSTPSAFIANQFNHLIDHTLLKPDASHQQIQKLIDEAQRHQFYSVCIAPCWVSFASQLLKDSPVAVCTVIGFPLGMNHSSVKAFEAEQAIKDGAQEIDMVINLGHLKSGDNAACYQDILAVAQVCKQRAILKVIIETCLLNDEQIKGACEIAEKAGADFVKTSTGFSSGGATTNAVKLMRQTVGNRMGVKASGGIDSRQKAIDMINAGATRIGASRSIELLVKEGSN